MNCLQLWCEFNNCQGGTIHQAKADFNKLPLSFKDKFCSKIMRNLSDIDDLENAKWFTNNRLSHIS